MMRHPARFIHDVNAGNPVGGPDAYDAKPTQPRSLLSAHRLDASTDAASGAASKRVQVVPQCFWDPRQQACDAEDAVNIMYAINARPGSAYLW
jgi:hypothetical protein